MLIGYYGLTHLGLSYLSASLYKGFRTIGYDKTSVLKKIKSKKYFKEPYIFEQIKKKKKKIFLRKKYQI
jgi:UDP-N-acetyl-D-mannosaminuronate dehydrogenase